MPRDAMSTTTFTLMDTSEDQVFLYVENKGQKTPFGTLYISDEGARSFSHSLTNVIKGNAVDFERVTSLDGTFIANKYVPREGETARIREKRHEKTLNAIAERDFGEDDMIAEERKKASRSRMSMSNNINRKQAEVDLESGMADMGVPAKEVE